jgi:hypothetical protein
MARARRRVIFCSNSGWSWRWRSPQLAHENRRRNQISVVLAPRTGRSLILTRRVSCTLDVLTPQKGHVTTERRSWTTTSSRSVRFDQDLDDADPLELETDRHTVGRQGGSSFSRLLSQPRVERFLLFGAGFEPVPIRPSSHVFADSLSQGNRYYDSATLFYSSAFNPRSEVAGRPKDRKPIKAAKEGDAA